ncbi:hypothetical protein T11_12483 [Trichinella zimbabwensis]|uniref:DUF1725 domain-containing protein n=1 Tax=Trichinella zimbabwensis TaxID=268475 RepID=A0A0V1DPV9_9BILA|nr:hypothetical protein T11_12483 [Trichinella zimbabwensis]
MEYYSAIKDKEIMNFAGKWMELEKYHLEIPTDPKKLNKKEGTSEDA